MPQNINTSRAKEDLPLGRKSLESQKESPSGLKERKEIVSAVEGLTENVEMGTGEVSETESKVAENQGKGTTSQKDESTIATVELPAIDVMILDSIEEIEGEIHNLTVEAVRLQNASQVDYNRLNEVVKRARYLNGILDALKNAANLAKEYIVNIWKEFVHSKE